MSHPDDLAGLDDHLAPWRWDELVTVASETFASEWDGKVFTPEVIEHEMAVLVAVHQEDMATCRNVQEGLASGLVDQIRLTALEATIADFQRWVRARLP